MSERKTDIDLDEMLAALAAAEREAAPRPGDDLVARVLSDAAAVSAEERAKGPQTPAPALPPGAARVANVASAPAMSIEAALQLMSTGSRRGRAVARIEPRREAVRRLARTWAAGASAAMVACLAVGFLAGYLADTPDRVVVADIADGLPEIAEDTEIALFGNEAPF